jgi:rhombotail lipoprotein
VNHTPLKQWSILLFAAGLAATLLLGCAAGTSKHYHSTSIVEYLYPGGAQQVQQPEVPVLSLPLTAGVAFVPDGSGGARYIFTERDKMALMKEVSNHFKQYDFVRSIELIPSAYLSQEGGFTNLSQVQTMYGVDVIALLSYDQTQFTDEGMLSISYWTIVGAYIVPGELNDTHTMVDAAIYDIASRKMLFRAPGISHIKGRSTPVNLSEQLRLDSQKGFEEASRELTINLQEQLALFEEKVKELPEDYTVVHKPGYTGSGSIGQGFLLLLAVCTVVGSWKSRTRIS